MSARRWLLVAVAAVALVLVAGRAGGALYVDHAWYAAMGAEALWRAKVMHTLLLRGVTALIGTAFVFANLYFVRHSIVSLVLPRRVGDLEIGEEVPGRTLMVGVLLLSAVLGALLTIPYGDWTLLAQAWRGVPYRELDPFHQVDLGFWVHWLPLETALYHWALLVLLVVSIVVVALYALTPSLRLDRGTMRVTSYVRRHLVVLGALALLLLAWSYRLDQYRLLVAGSGPEDLFTWADHRVRLAANAALAVLALVIAGLVLLTGWVGQTRRAFVGVTLVLLLSVALRQALPAIFERTQAPREYAAREGPYERTRAAYTRRSVALETLLPPDSADLAAGVPPDAGMATVAVSPLGISAWDAGALETAVVRGHRGTVAVGDPGWGAGPRGLEALVVLRPATDATTDPAAAWIGTRVDASVALDGAPALSETPLAPPLVWPGARGYALRDDPTGQVLGARLSSTVARLAHAWGEQNLRLLDGALASRTSRLVLRRDVRERVAALAPFFAQGTAVTPVLSGRTLYWVLHLYAATDWYPLAGPVHVGGHEWRSWHRAATAVVDAGTGRVRFVLATDRDAIAETWVRMFPTLFTAADSLPAALLALMPADADAARAQAIALGAAGLRSDGAALRRVLADASGDSLATGGPTPFLATGAPAVALASLDGAGTLSGVVVARGGAQPAARWLPAGPGAPSWDLARERLLRGADSTASRDGRVVAGALRTVPLADRGMALLLSHYRWRGDAAPELLRTAALVGDTTRAGRTLAAALGAPRDSVPGELPAGDPASDGRAAALYDRMREALRRGDLRAFAEAFDALGSALGRSPP